MLTKYVPDKYQKSIYTINYKKLKREGIKCLIFDLDNTLVPASVNEVSKKLKDFSNDLKIMGFKVIIMSNSQKNRVQIFQKALMVDAAALSFKPNKDKYEKIIKLYGFKAEDIACIGDSITTDILGANKMEFTSILVNSMSKSDHYIKFFNKLEEKRILNNLRKKDLLVKERYYD